jgi:hypothetical protein
MLHQSAETDPHLELIVAAWATLPEHIKSTVMVLVRAAGGRA